MGVVFVPDDKSSVRLEPANAAFDSVPTFVTTERTTILSWRLDSVLAVRADQFNVLRFQPCPQRVTVPSEVIDQSLRLAVSDAIFEQRLDPGDFGTLGFGKGYGERRSFTVGQEHDLGAFALLAVANRGAPFFAGQNVPSPRACSQSILRKQCSFPSNRRQAFSKIPDSVHSLSRRQHVAGEGYRSGKSFQRAPLWSTQSTPSRQARGGTRGLPPRGETGGCGNKSAIVNHCSSLRYGGGAVLDPVRLRPRGGHNARVSSMLVSPFASTNVQIPCQTVHHLESFETTS